MYLMFQAVYSLGTPLQNGLNNGLGWFRQIALEPLLSGLPDFAKGFLIGGLYDGVGTVLERELAPEQADALRPRLTSATRALPVRIADVREVRPQVERLDEAAPRLAAALEIEREDGAGAARQIPRREQIGEGACAQAAIGAQCHGREKRGRCDADLRGRGLAAPAMAAVVRMVLADIAPTVSLYVNDFNTAALALYRRVAQENRRRRDAGDQAWQGIVFSLDPATYAD